MQSLSHQFLTFCRSKPADEVYNYFNTEGCALYQFLTEAGYPVSGVGGVYWREGALGTNSCVRHYLPDGMPIAISMRPHTFSALADRLEALLSEGVAA